MSDVMAVFDFRGDTADLLARYDVAVHRVVEIASGRPVVHLAIPRDYGVMVCDVWSDEAAMRRFTENPEIHRLFDDVGLPEPEIRVFPVHRLGWPVSELPLYR